MFMQRKYVDEMCPKMSQTWKEIFQLPQTRQRVTLYNSCPKHLSLFMVYCKKANILPDDHLPVLNMSYIDIELNTCNVLKITYSATGVFCVIVATVCRHERHLMQRLVMLGFGGQCNDTDGTPFQRILYFLYEHGIENHPKKHDSWLTSPAC